jgi:cyclopropane fatty-acyl-phospholipid synthase-like methyltransferase
MINTVMYWLLLVFSFLIALLLVPNNIILTLALAIALYIIFFVILEILYFKLKLNIWNEQERVASSYKWFDIYLDTNGKNNKGDLTEGYFANNNWNISPELALKQKYDKFFEILGLQPGMKVLDIGCGYGQWMSYLKSRQVSSVGLTLAQVHVDEGIKRNLDIRLQDGRTMTFKAEFDAVTLLGSLEHFAKIYQTPSERLEVYKSIMRKSKLALNPASTCGKIMTTTLNVDTSNWKIKDFIKGYILERFYSGRYPVPGELNTAAASANLRRTYYSDQTEDYRWMSIINQNHFGNFTINHWTLNRIFYAFAMFLTDPFAVHKWVYHNHKIWMWHLGGQSQTPDRNRESPCRLKWECFG